MFDRRFIVLDFDRILIIIKMFKFGTSSKKMFGYTSIFFGHNLINKFIHTIFTFEMISSYTVDTLSIRLDSEHSFFQNHSIQLYNSSILKFIIYLFIKLKIYNFDNFYISSKVNIIKFNISIHNFIN